MYARFMSLPSAPWLILGMAGLFAQEPVGTSAFRVRPYLQNPAPDAMTVRWFSQSSAPGKVTVDGRTMGSQPELCEELDYQGAEPLDQRSATPPYLHSVRVTGLSPATSYPYEVEQDGETIKAILTTAPKPGDVGRGGAVRLFAYADSGAQPESRGHHVDWTPSTALPGGPRPRWVRDQYLTDETTGYRTNLACIASRAAESLRAGNPVLVSVVGDLVESGGEQRDWDEFWRHNAGVFGSLASRVPLVAALGEREICGGPKSNDPLADLGGFSGPASLLGSRKFLTYFEHPDNGAADIRHLGRYHRVDFGPVTLLTLDATNSGPDGSAMDTNLLLDRGGTPHIPDLAPESEQHHWLEQQLADARDRGAVTFVQVHQAPFSSGRHGRPPGRQPGADEHSGHALRRLAPLLRQYGVRVVISGHDTMYEHSIVQGVHFYAVGIGGDALTGNEREAVNERQIFMAHEHAPEHWTDDVLVSGGKHYGHLEIDVRRPADRGDDSASGSPAEFEVTITPVYVFPVLDPDRPGEIVAWERREYDDRLVFRSGDARPPGTPPPLQEKPR